MHVAYTKNAKHCLLQLFSLNQYFFVLTIAVNKKNFNFSGALLFAVDSRKGLTIFSIDYNL